MAAAARRGAQLSATRHRLRAEESARINSPEYKVKKLVAAQRSAEHKADTKQEIGSAKANDYAAARRLLDSLAEEAQHPRREELPDE